MKNRYPSLPPQSRDLEERLLDASTLLGFEASTKTPLIGCGRRAAACRRMRGDYWLAGGYEKRVAESLFSRAFNVTPAFEHTVLIYHRIPAPRGEYAVEIITSGARLGAIEYVPGRAWTYYPSGYAASIAEGLGAPVYTITGWKGRLKGKKIQVPGIACRDGESWILVSTGDWIGPARIASRNRSSCTVKVKDMAPRGFTLLRQDVEEVVEHNQQLLGFFAQEARRFIRSQYARIQASRGKVFVAYSGGADSTALLFLVAETVTPSRVVAVYADTGMEFLETRRYVEKITSMLGVDLEIVEPESNPLNEIAKRGLMTRDNRWCTRLLKITPLRAFYEKKGVKLVFDGARRWESENRARTPRVGVNPLMPGIVRALPIYHWPRLLVQLFLYEKKIPLNPLYSKGLVRIGCIACPAMHLYELHIAYSLHREWFEKLAKAIEGEKDSGNNAISFILSGEWRYGLKRA